MIKGGFKNSWDIIKEAMTKHQETDDECFSSIHGGQETWKEPWQSKSDKRGTGEKKGRGKDIGTTEVPKAAMS